MATTSENVTHAPVGKRRNLNLGSPERAGAVLAALCEHLEELHERGAGRSDCPGRVVIRTLEAGR